MNITSQYTYFNHLSLEGGLPFGYYDTGTNLEIVGDEFIVWGGKAVEGVPSQFVRRYDQNGNILNEKTLHFGDTLVYIGITSSFLSIPETTDFLFVHAIVADSVQGFIIKFNENLDTLWSRSYNDYAPETYLYTHSASDNGFILAGEHGPEIEERGTFIMEIDGEGEVLWHQEIHAPDEGAFRNRSISQFNNNYIVSGIDQNGNDSQSYIEILSDSGDLLDHIEPPNTPLGGGGSLYHFINSQNEIIVYQSASYEWITPPSIAYNMIRVFTLDVEEVQLNIENEYFTNNDLSGTVIKMIEANDGYALAGIYRDLDNNNAHKGWIMKLDSEFQHEWYTELSFDDALGNWHNLSDMEQTSDGGYVVLGSYRNSEDFYDRTWLVKLDACGDLDWQGCEAPDGIFERETILPVKIFPNPAIDHVSFELDSHIGYDVIEVHDMFGQRVLKISYQKTIDVSTLQSGMYTVRILINEGVIHLEKLIIE